MKFGAVIIAILPALAAAMPAPAASAPADEPSSSSVKLSSASYTGNGCPSGSVAITSKGGAWTSTYSKYVANSGSGVKADQNTRTCNTTLNFQIPDGWKFSLSSVISRGFMEVEKNMGVGFSTGFSIDGHAQRPNSLTLFGPLKGDRTVQAAFDAGIYSACGGKVTLVVNSQIKVSAKEGTDGGKDKNTITIDAQDHSLSWQKC